MKIWLATIGEPVPIGEGESDRLHRTGHLARFMAGRGHSTVWWTSAFDHFRKRHLCASDRRVQLDRNLEIRLLRGRGYRRNLSLDRLLDHAEIAEKFAVEAEQSASPEARPDLIVAALPSIDLAAACADFGVRYGIPVVLDMRDMWPDIFIDTAPETVRPLARVLLQPMFRQARRACSQATAIAGITEAFVNWGLARGCRPRTPLDRAFPLGYSAEAPSPHACAAADEKWDSLRIGKDGRFTVCFFGSLSRQLDLMHVLDAARQLEGRRVPVRFVLCGAGERLERYRQAAAGLGSVVFPGWADRAAIYALLRRADAGLDPLPRRYDFLATVNNKAIEYLSAEVPVLSTPRQGVLAELLATRGCGYTYDEGDARGLAALIEGLAADPSRLAGVRNRARALFEEQFQAEKVYAAMESHFERMANRNHACHIACA